MRTLMLVAALALAGCATPQEQAARKQAAMERDMVVYGPACARLGYQANSDLWRNCVLQLSTKEELTRYAGYPSYYAGFGPRHWYGGAAWGPYW